MKLEIFHGKHARRKLMEVLTIKLFSILPVHVSCTDRAYLIVRTALCCYWMVVLSPLINPDHID